MGKFKDFEATLNGKKINVRVRTPNGKDIKDGQSIYAKAFNQAIKDGFMLRAKAWQIIEDQEIYTKKDAAETEELFKKLFDLEYKLTTQNLPDGEPGKKDKNTKYNIAIEMKKLRDRIYELQLKRASIDNNTAEAQADNMRLNFFVYRCTFNKDTEKPIFASFEEFDENTIKTDENEELFEIALQATKIFSEVYLNIEDSINASIENKVLQSIGFTDEKGRLINKDKHLISIDGKLVDENGNLVNEKGQKIDINGRPFGDDGKYIKT